MGAIHFSIDLKLLETIIQKNPFDAFVETGTYKGDSVDAIRHLFAEIHTIELSEECIRFLIDEGFDMQFGARPLKRLLQKKVLDGLSMALLEGRVRPGMFVRIDVKDGAIVFESEKFEHLEVD